MEVKINKEVRDYTESLFMGLSMRQCIYSAIACVIAVIIYYQFNPLLGLEITSWLCILGALPLAALGFISIQSMTAGQIVATAYYSFLLSRRQLVDKPFNLYMKMYGELIERYTKEALGKNDKKLSKIKKTK